MDPGLIALYSRSKYSGFRRVLETDEKAARQHERFAVAATAFALKHDKSFRKHFLMRVCECPDSLASMDFKTLIEPWPWGDLVLKNAKAVFVIEFKIRAKLANHQDPTSERFFCKWDGEGKVGYGRRILDEFGRAKFITVQNQAGFEAVEVDGLHCLSKTWRSLWKRSESPLESDLFDCLERLGVNLTPPAKMKMRTTIKTADAAKIGSVLKDILDKAKLSPSGDYYELDSGHDRKGDWWFGLNVPKRSNGKLQSLLCPGWKNALWVGYQGSSGRAAYRAIWLYCGKAAKQDKIRQRLKGETVVPHDDMSLEIKSLASDSLADEKWFNNVFERLLKS